MQRYGSSIDVLFKIFDKKAPSISPNNLLFLSFVLDLICFILNLINSNMFHRPTAGFGFCVSSGLFTDWCYSHYPDLTCWGSRWQLNICTPLYVTSQRKSFQKVCQDVYFVPVFCMWKCFHEYKQQTHTHAHVCSHEYETNTHTHRHTYRDTHGCSHEYETTNTGLYFCLCEDNNWLTFKQAPEGKKTGQIVHTMVSNQNLSTQP